MGRAGVWQLQTHDRQYEISRSYRLHVARKMGIDVAEEPTLSIFKVHDTHEDGGAKVFESIRTYLSNTVSHPRRQ